MMCFSVSIDDENDDNNDVDYAYNDHIILSNIEGIKVFDDICTKHLYVYWIYAYTYKYKIFIQICKAIEYYTLNTMRI